MNSLERTFGELGITQYLGAFVDQGFDSWETILDITESDLDKLGVKLGHRRKLQRRIANYRGLAPDASLVSPTRTSIEDVRQDASRPEPAKTDTKEGNTVTKRKYRRHPKPDENAPERPPSAYVLFSNKMREDLKGQNLTFTEIAKLVGENWQNLTREEKEPFETQAHQAKEKYNRDLAEYKKTHEWKKYNDYLHDFRKRQATQTQEKDVSKRLKTDVDGSRGNSGVSIGPSGTTSTNGSGTESQPGSEPPPTRQQRMGSSTSTTEAFHATAAGLGHIDEPTNSPRTYATEDYGYGRPRGLSSPGSREPLVRPRAGWADGARLPSEPSSIGVPWLDPRAMAGTFAHSPENTLLSRTPSQGHGRGSLPIPEPPSLRTEPSYSSNGSISSASSHNMPRTPSDAVLPIHALLSSKPDSSNPPHLVHQSSSGMSTQGPSVLQPLSSWTSDDHLAQGLNSHSSHSNKGYVSTPTIPNSRVRPSVAPVEPTYTAPDHQVLPSTPELSASNESGLDGISALLRAREIVDRRP
ncbi:hypothetical protein F5Y15DRAFT_431268 [Xylariaceae sp. FL0016]|nr:hypothetical protein F5Y15DRAFT_431268 [Xylariaceae sp. FL0016]